MSVLEGSENDMRFVYCACCVCYMLDDWTAMDIEGCTRYIVNSLVSTLYRMDEGGRVCVCLQYIKSECGVFLYNY